MREDSKACWNGGAKGKGPSGPRALCEKGPSTSSAESCAPHSEKATCGGSGSARCALCSSRTPEPEPDPGSRGEGATASGPPRTSGTPAVPGRLESGPASRTVPDFLGKETGLSRTVPDSPGAQRAGEFTRETSRSPAAAFGVCPWTRRSGCGPGCPPAALPWPEVETAAEVSRDFGAEADLSTWCASSGFRLLGSAWSDDVRVASGRDPPTNPPSPPPTSPPSPPPPPLPRRATFPPPLRHWSCES
mmetsp:Transcript_30645/g.71446  ORF Transcript_30645/g.71446 Transcript_30645/m.71446 type:complete len:247 (-) Transcript_30645:245-985(-)